MHPSRADRVCVCLDAFDRNDGKQANEEKRCNKETIGRRKFTKSKTCAIIWTDQQFLDCHKTLYNSQFEVARNAMQCKFATAKRKKNNKLNG